ncbi:hypothetical protein ACWATR_28405 [Nostoc sp. UIC 10890]
MSAVFIVAIAPLIILWLKNNTFAALVVCAWIVAFSPSYLTLH